MEQRERPPAVAGLFYPESEEELKSLIIDFLNHVKEGASQAPPKAIISPHAGYIYSGPVAATAYKTIEPVADQIKKVILLGPAHRVAFQGLALPDATQFKTPLGDIPLDLELTRELLSLPFVHESDAAHGLEHSLEVQLPFLQTILPSFTLLPIVVGDADTNEVAEVLERVWGGNETLIVISSDLSHYLSYEGAKKSDEKTSQAILKLNPDEISYDQACGRLPIQGLLKVAKKKGLSAKVLDLRNSGDTAGPKTEVVGYGAYVFSEK